MADLSVHALAHAAFKAAIAVKPGGRFMIRQRIRVVKRHPERTALDQRPSRSFPEGQFPPAGRRRSLLVNAEG